ncbi:guanine nucleotide-binding protein subunit gamma 2 isoform X1 [Brassica napus]|uniref:guanine nucleotide-binding protein subunit gamma 2 isoform X1 n=1 Tax=Brassica oleracea var. oleracea TaxID=109376 RepID=UPI0006A6BEEE|nr:PREDICTED: guanine nucleotide-binding protein subunit gamma 2 isoform X1 [Brassica oleracea var. oleracea]XP_022550836.2 guanine nucleotide-binding protein subunit gamma 2 isoform X1 [Brassica napus]
MEVGSSNSSGQLSERVVDTRGKHRIHAQLNRLQQEARFLEEELEQLEKMDKASASCKEFLHSVDSKPDPLLPLRASERDMGSMVRTSERSKTMWMLHSLIFISSYSYVVTFISMSSYKSLRYCFSSPGGLIDVIGKKERKKNHLCRKNLLIY